MEILISILLVAIVVTSYYYRLKRIEELRELKIKQHKLDHTLQDRHVTCWYCGKPGVIQTDYPTLTYHCSNESCIKTRREIDLKRLGIEISDILKQGTLIQKMEEENEKSLATHRQKPTYHTIPGPSGPYGVVLDIYYGDVFIMVGATTMDINDEPDLDLLDERLEIFKEELAKYQSRAKNDN